ncbi:mycofactocin-coupled SDR family oxidoreductase [Mycolicibacterium litorale]|uniref:mycofactocin-coupled SDR family oxidoreductase n=1 Tax=Mycolicibacterium litorale TaxID=758802 RepID=UPI003CE9E86F
MGRLENKVAFITGAARGQGRAHAVTMAGEGADIIAVDICRQMAGVGYPMATPEDLAETVRQVEALGRNIIAVEADCRDSAAMRAAAADGAAKLGGIDIGVINHGILIAGPWDSITDEAFDLAIETNLTAAWRASRAVIPHLIERGGGSLMITASAAAVRPSGSLSPYVAAKTGVIGLAKALAIDLAPSKVRVNAICPGNVATPMIHNQMLYDIFSGRPGGTQQDIIEPMQVTQLLPLPWYEPEVIAEAALYLASDAGRFVTGTEFVVDAGLAMVPPGVPERTAAELGSLRAQLDALKSGTSD